MNAPLRPLGLGLTLPSPNPHRFKFFLFNSALIVSIIIIFGIKSALGSQIVHHFLPPDCKAVCDESRPNGVRESFKFKCNDTYDSEKDIIRCRESCENCPKEVCDETVENNQWTWHCPQLLDVYFTHHQECVMHCNQHRPWGTRESFSLDCDSAYSNQAAKDACKSKCSKCPDFICRKDKPHLFYCPTETLDGECEKECDKARGLGDVGSFQFKCDVKYSGDDTSTNDCQKACKTHCPEWACDKRSTSIPNFNEFHCPALKLPAGSCLDFCEETRPKENFGIHKLDCESHPIYKSQCDTKCGECQRTSGTGSGPICDLANPKIFHCPKKQPENRPPAKERSYKGACRTRCERNQGGGIRGYYLNCDARYVVQEEKDACNQDCTNECAENDCSYEGIKCKGIKKEIEKEDKAIEDLKNTWEKEGEKAKDLRLKASRKKSDTNPNFTHGLIFGLIAVISLLIGVSVYLSRRRKGKVLGLQREIILNDYYEPQQIMQAVEIVESQETQQVPSVEGGAVMEANQSETG